MLWPRRSEGSLPAVLMTGEELLKAYRGGVRNFFRVSFSKPQIRAFLGYHNVPPIDKGLKGIEF